MFFESQKQRFPSNPPLWPQNPSSSKLQLGSIAPVCAHQIWHFHESTLRKCPHWFNLSWMSSLLPLNWLVARQCEHEKAKDVEKKPLGGWLSFYLKNNPQMNREEENCLQLQWTLSLSLFIVQLQVFPVSLACNSLSFASILPLNANLRYSLSYSAC